MLTHAVIYPTQPMMGEHVQGCKVDARAYAEFKRLYIVLQSIARVAVQWYKWYSVTCNYAFFFGDTCSILT